MYNKQVVLKNECITYQNEKQLHEKNMYFLAGLG